MMATEPLGSAPDARAYFLLPRQKKVAKEKATPGYAVGYADFAALLDGPGGCATRGYAPRTVLADYPRPISVARRSTQGPKQRRNFSENGEITFGVPCPLRGTEQRRAFGGLRLALSEPKASLASRPTARVAQGTGVAGTDPGSPSSLATFFLATQEESTPADQRRNPAVEQPPKQPIKHETNAQ